MVKFMAHDLPDEDPLPLRVQIEVISGLDKRCMILRVVDKDGQWFPGGNLLSIDEKGVKLLTKVNPDFGLALDDEGKLVVSSNSGTQGTLSDLLPPPTYVLEK